MCVPGDPVKLLLALLSLVYDSLLMTQHYLLYPVRPTIGPSEERQAEGDIETDQLRLVPAKTEEGLAR